ncbi:LLM class flavin-dependent oxidoreductase [Streptomyces sp. CB00316]|uniref:LLM class flavin-dependent oxidoreductase n=1 Tax=Streptomyces sp. CB00316 TaxID=1703932 RepID=UPI002D21D9D0|nr:hypothetical protein [Streptomyces sp. CB00316]
MYAVPGPAQDRLNGVIPTTGRLPVWLLGSSGYSAQLAARLGLPFAFAAHFNPRDAVSALRPYRRRLTPSEALAEPYALVSFTVAASDDEREPAARPAPSHTPCSACPSASPTCCPPPRKWPPTPTTPRNAEPSTTG